MQKLGRMQELGTLCDLIVHREKETEMEDDKKRTVIIKLLHQQQNCPRNQALLKLQHEKDGLISPQIDRKFTSRCISSLLFLSLITFFLWQLALSSLPTNENDINSQPSMAYSMSSKLLVSSSLNSSLTSQSIPAYPNHPTPHSIAKLVQRDVLRNEKVGNEAVANDDVEEKSTTVFPIRGDVYPNGLYYVNLRVGNPPKEYFLDVDTGSDLTWLQCDAPCTSCAKGPHPLYKPRKTNLVKCNEPLCSVVQAGGTIGCQGGSSQCDYEIRYADGGSSLGVLVSDKMILLLTNGSLTQTKAVFGCGYDQQGSLAKSPASTDGVLGLSSSRVSLPSQWAEQGLIKNIIAHCIPSNGAGYLFFGDKLLPSQGITWAPMLGKPSARNYALAVENIFFGDTLIKIGGKAFGSAIFDSGSSYTYFVSPVYTAIVSLVSNSFVGSDLQQDESDQTLNLCWHGSHPFRSVDEVQDLVKTITLEFKTNGWFTKISKMHIPPQGYLIVNLKGNVCLGILDAKVLGQHSAAVIGDISMQGNLVVYDNENNRMGWMKTDCRTLPRTAAPSPPT